MKFFNVSLHQYLKEKKKKKQTNRLLKKKKKRTHETKALLQLQCAHNAKTLDAQWHFYYRDILAKF